MATYFHGTSEMQSEGLQTLYLMNPSYNCYSDPNMILLNSTAVSRPIENHIHSHQQQQYPENIPNLWTPQSQQATNSRAIEMAAAMNSGRQELSLSLLSPGEGLQRLLIGCKYLKAAQEVLDEVVSVGRGIEVRKKNCRDRDSEAIDEDSSGRTSGDLNSADKQELQMKKAKLVRMFDEVEQRYRQYRHQMQIVVSSFEAIAGPGSATTYTALALQTISKQFRCLGDAIIAQIRSTSKSLGEEDSKTIGSRLRFVDHHLRQQRALQQLGIVQHNAWRPQRGLPERSVSILRAWLFEHFLHPYPKDSDKLLLAKQTGLTRSQVSNWFINARVRLWKPMVEEMYLEEVKDQEQSNAKENSNKSESSAQQESSPATEGLDDNLKTDQAQASYPRNSLYQASYETVMEPILNKARSNESTQGNAAPNSMSLDLRPENTSDQELMMKLIEGRQVYGHGGNNYGAFTIGEIGRFNAERFAPMYSNNGVSLTLGLDQSLLSNESMAGRIEMSSDQFCNLNNNSVVNHSSGTYDGINLQNRKDFAAQLLPDYVA